MCHDDRALLAEMFAAAVKAADPHHTLPANLPPIPSGRTVVVGAGKASAVMAQALEAAWPTPLEGLVVVPHGSASACRQIEVIEASHPLPDAASLKAADRLLGLVSGLSESDLVIALISGGGSALLSAPPSGFTLADDIAINTALLNSGAPITAMNVVRTHLSRIKGGRLAAATRARVHTMVVSDVPGDDPTQVASGPTLPGRATRAQALEIAKRYRLVLPERVLDYLASPDATAPSPDDEVFRHHTHCVISSAAVSLKAASEVARAHGLAARILSDAIEGEAREVARWHAAIARHVKSAGEPFSCPVVILSGGETTVTIRGKGRGGRNGEFALSLAIELDGVSGITALAADTDGIDGTETNAGAFVSCETVRRLRDSGIAPQGFLDDNDSYSAFQRIGDLFETGPTGTNVNDFRAIIVR